MPYQRATHAQDYSDFASGRVLYHSPGFPAFPVRLASEIFQRARALLAHLPRLTLYDPTCGGAYHLTALGMLHAAEIGAILASDTDPTALDLARRNLGLLTDAGLDQREAEIRALLRQFGKPSHQDALRSLAVLRNYRSQQPSIPTRVFQANVFNPADLHRELAAQQVHLVIADIPYGHLSSWNAGSSSATDDLHSPLWHMLDALQPILPDETVVAIAADKAQKIAHAGYRRVSRFIVGKRQVALLTPARPG